MSGHSGRQGSGLETLARKGISMGGWTSMSKDVSSQIVKSKTSIDSECPRSGIGVSLVGQSSVRYLGNSMESRTTEISS